MGDDGLGAEGGTVSAAHGLHTEEAWQAAVVYLVALPHASYLLVSQRESHTMDIWAQPIVHEKGRSSDLRHGISGHL